VEKLHRQIDNNLKAVWGVHANLERRFFKDMRRIASSPEIEEMSIALKPWRNDDYLVHAILDCIYTCPAALRWELLGKLIYLIRNFASREELLEFKGEVAGNFAS
jgi:hypothetical protein